MYKYDIFNITEITSDIIQYFKNNTDIAKEQYNLLTESAKVRGLDKSKLNYYTEKHHIIARCMNGDDSKDNLVLLTYQEHVLAHMLLYTMNPDNKDLFLSFSLLIKEKHGEVKTFSINLDYLTELKEERSRFMRGDNNPMKNPEVAKKMSKSRKGIASFAGKHHTEETKKLLSEKTKSLNFKGENHPMYGKKHTKESIEKMRLAHKGQQGHPHTEESKRKISEARMKKVQGPDGTIYNSVNEAAKAIGVGRDVMSRYINHRPEKGFKYLT